MKRVPRVKTPSRTVFFKTIFQAQQPVIFENALRAWPWIKDAPRDPESLLRLIAEQLGDKQIKIHHAARPLRHHSDWELAKTSFHQFISGLIEGTRRPSSDMLVLGGSLLLKKRPKIAATMPPPILRQDVEKSVGPHLWIGSGGHKTLLHFDIYHNFSCMVLGKKRFTVFSPGQMSNLYLRRFPNSLRGAQLAEVGPGDVLFLPAFWWHRVESIGVNVCVNFWWDRIAAADVNAAWQFFERALRTLRPLPAEHRRIWKSFFDHFVFMEDGDPRRHLPAAEKRWRENITPQFSAMLRRWLVEEPR